MDSFEARKRSSGVQSRIRRLVNLTVPNLDMRQQGARAENRDCRVIPALLCPWESHCPVADASAFVLTKDFSSEGVGVLLAQPFRAEQVVISFWLDSVMNEPWHFLGVSQCLRKFGGGYWTLGIELTEFVDENRRCKLLPLMPLVEQLRA